MAVPSTKATLKTYCLRALGFGVIDINVSDIENRNDGVLITGLPFNTDYSDDALKKLITDMQTWKKVRMIGSAAMASCYVASGKADLYHENGIYLWDIIA